MTILSQNNNNKNPKNIINCQKIENKMNYYKNVFRNNNIYQAKKYETNSNNCIYIKDLKKIQKNITNKKYLFNLKKDNNNNKILETNDIKKGTIKNKKETSIDNLSSQSMSDSKIYELTTNYMNLDEFIDKNQIKNILSNKRSKKIQL